MVKLCSNCIHRHVCYLYMDIDSIFREFSHNVTIKAVREKMTDEATQKLIARVEGFRDKILSLAANTCPYYRRERAST